jgi:hypothetical protein
MDRDRFDALARVLATRGSRRITLGALFGALLGSAGETSARKQGKDKDSEREKHRQSGRQMLAERGGHDKGRKRRKRKRGRKDNPGTPGKPTPGCCGAKSCSDPEAGSTRSDCDFAGESFAGEDLNGSILRGIDGRGANFNDTDNRGSVFAEACLQGATFRGARLGGSTWGGACLFEADFRNADLGGESAVFHGALFCATRMPDGSLNDRDCERATACCQRELAAPGPGCDCTGKQCGPDGCGGSCGTCPAGEACNGAGLCICVPQSCPAGCCDGNQVCEPGNTNQVCGTGGALCVSCGAGQACQNQRCACVPQCTGKACGPDGCGGSCGDCQGGQSCGANGQCICSEASCPGCCDANQVCQQGTTKQHCGGGGGSCATCDQDQGCQDGQCVPCSQTFDCPCVGQSVCTDPNSGFANCRLLDNQGVCTCMVSTQGEPICQGASGSSCGTDEDCQSFAPGSVCVAAVAGSDDCGFATNFCAAPCPAH